ncbi:MAG: doubled CXXCH domain-containing [Actinobacteria bacterium]|nr:MAG: doubled CXXCH domain-containing [Actinomycetota bacterium]
MRAPARAFIVLATTAVVLFALASVAVAYDEPGGLSEHHKDADGVVHDCISCHMPDASGKTACNMCHWPRPTDVNTSVKGPHGSYSTATKRCDACHAVHDAGGTKLLPGATTTASCNACHDGTGGRGVYGAIMARTGTDPVVAGGMHAIDTTSVVPGGNFETGGSATMALTGVGGTLGCDDCHSPHDSQTVTGFPSERWRSSWRLNVITGFKSNKLLRQRPGDTTGTPVTEYGSDWCLACHKGRGGSSVAHNHPSESSATTSTPFTYANVARLASDDATSVTTTGTLAATNRGYLIPFPRTTQQGAHLPICQQCHEDSRNVGTLNENIGDATPFSITATDGLVPADNPRFQNFPHETLSFRLLVEAKPTYYDDDLCLNCHVGSQLN